MEISENEGHRGSRKKTGWEGLGSCDFFKRERSKETCNSIFSSGVSSSVRQGFQISEFSFRDDLVQ